MIILCLIPFALIVGFLRGGSARNYAKKPIRAPLLPVCAFLIEALYGKIIPALPLPPAMALAACVCAQYALLAAFCLFNIRRAAGPFLLIGTAMNFSVIAANGFRMPVAISALRTPALSSLARRIASGELMEYVAAGPDAPLYRLGDVIEVPFLPGGLASAGDIALGLGVFLLILEALGKREKP